MSLDIYESNTSLQKILLLPAKRYELIPKDYYILLRYLQSCILYNNLSYFLYKRKKNGFISNLTYSRRILSE